MSAIYIAGPMRGIPYLNFVAFDRAAKVLRKDGWEVINPADMYRIGSDKPEGWLPEREPDDPFLGWDRKETIMVDLGRLVRECDAIYLLKGWERSVGATAEMSVAEWAKLRIIEQREYEVGKAFASFSSKQ
jgi:hypothetical protein